MTQQSNLFNMRFNVFLPSFIFIGIHLKKGKDLKEKLSQGCDYPMSDISENNRMGDLNEQISRGNHISAIRHEHFLWVLPNTLASQRMGNMLKNSE
mmetsp:Transcript_21724/g.24730  ORF Transcript_21724/g.24730 Transcript_21724/m.24730 type:complete len:96 (-) Transcript_21724:257-544(-)